jgi:hypothetical protein
MSFWAPQLGAPNHTSTQNRVAAVLHSLRNADGRKTSMVPTSAKQGIKTARLTP